jgi:hypothetical protein
VKCLAKSSRIRLLSVIGYTVHVQYISCVIHEGEIVYVTMYRASTVSA